MALADILAAPDKDWVYLVEVTLPTLGLMGWTYGPVASSHIGHATLQFSPFISQPISLRIEVGAQEIGGSAGSTWGSINLSWDRDLGLDSLADAIWDGAPVTVKLGLSTTQYSSFSLLFSGNAEAVLYDYNTLSIVLRSPGSKLDDQVQSNLYLGDGTIYEGYSSLKDTHKPILLGTCYNVTPVLVDRDGGPAKEGKGVFQVNDGPIKSVMKVYDGGSVYNTSAGDFPNAITTDLAVPPAGRFSTDLAKGLFRIANRTFEQVTADVEGVNNDPVAAFAEYASECVRHLAQVRGHLTNGELDIPSFATLWTDDTYKIGWYSGQNVYTVIAVIREILDGSGAYAYFTPLGSLSVGQLRWRTSSLSILHNSGQGIVLSVQRVQSPLPVWSWTLGYKKNWTVQTELGASLVAGDPQYEFARTEYRKTCYEDTATKTTHPLAREVESNSFYNAAADALAEATRRLGNMNSGAATFEVVFAEVQWLIKVGTTITISYPRFGWDNGFDFIVLSVAEDAVSKLTTVLVYG